MTQYNETITGSADYIPIKATINGLDCNNCTKEIRVVNAPCNSGGDVVDAFVYSESGSSPTKTVELEYLGNYTGDNSTYSIYYNNPSATDNDFNLIKGYESSDYSDVEVNGVNITHLTKVQFEGYPCGDSGIDSNCNSINSVKFPDDSYAIEPMGSTRGLGQFMDYNSHYIAPNANTTLHGFDCGFGGTLCTYKVFANSGNTEIQEYTWAWKFYYRGDNAVLIWLNATQNVTNSYTSGAGTGAIEYPMIPFRTAPFNSGRLTNGNWYYSDGADSATTGDFSTEHGATAIGDNFHGTYNGTLVSGVINKSGTLYHLVGESLATVQDSDSFKDGQSTGTGIKYQTLYYFFNESGSWENIKDMGNILENILVELGATEYYEAPTTTSTTTTVPETTTSTIPQCPYLTCEGLVSDCMCGIAYTPSSPPYYCCSFDSSTEALQSNCLIACASVTTTSTPTTTTVPICEEIDMYLHYKLENTTGEYLFDSSGNDRYGTTYNSPDWVEGKIGNAILFNGYSQYFVVANDDYDKFERTEPFSFSVWVKTNGTEGGFDFLTNYNDYVSLSGFSFGVMYGQIGFTLRNNIYTDNYLSATADNDNIYDNTFHHVVVTYDGTSTTNGTKIYVDNELMGFSATHDTLTDSTLNANPITTGIAEGSATYGVLDDIRIYNRMLREREIDYLYNYGDGTQNIIYDCYVFPDVMVQKSCINGDTQLLTNTTYYDSVTDTFYSTLNSTYCEYGCGEIFPLGTRCKFQPAVEWGIGIVLIFLMVVGIMYLRGVMGW
jgi:hypothetical protein